jgi:hypothetical protein
MTDVENAKNVVHDSIIEPWKAYRKLAASLHNTHNDSIAYLAQAIECLIDGSDGDTAMQGSGADALVNILFTYAMQARKLTGYDPTFLCQRLDDAARLCEKYAVALQADLNKILDPQEDNVTGAAGALGVGAASQDFLNPFWDAAALAGAGLAALDQSSHASQAQQAVADVDFAADYETKDWAQDMKSGPDTEGLPQLPEDPQKPDFNFNQKLGIGAGLAAAIIAGTAIVVNLSRQQELDWETLKLEFPNVNPNDIKDLLSAGFTPDAIRNILRAGFTHSQLQAIITRIRVAQKDPHGTDQYGLTADQIRKLAEDVANAVNSPDPGKQLEGRIARALIGDLVSFNRKVYDPKQVSK